MLPNTVKSRRPCYTVYCNSHFFCCLFFFFYGKPNVGASLVPHIWEDSESMCEIISQFRKLHLPPSLWLSGPEKSWFHKRMNGGMIYCFLLVFLLFLFSWLTPGPKSSGAHPQIDSPLLWKWSVSSWALTLSTWAMLGQRCQTCQEG